MKIYLQIQILDESIPIPSYAHSGDAAFDLMSRVDAILHPQERMTLPTGIALAIPRGYGGFISSRSGLSHRQGLMVVNAPGLIDADYRGEIGVILFNSGRESVVINKGDRIAQMTIQQVLEAEFLRTAVLPDTSRSGGGFGSTGK